MRERNTLNKITSSNAKAKKIDNQIATVETITNSEGHTVQLIRTPYGIGSANIRREGVTDEQLQQLQVNPVPFP